MTEIKSDYDPQGGDAQPTPPDHRGMGLPAPQPIILPGGFDAIHAIVSGLMADKQELQAELQAVRAELATAQQALAGWAAQEAVRTGGNRQSPGQRFAATLQAWRRQVPYAQQARIIAELLTAEEGEKPC